MVCLQLRVGALLLVACVASSSYKPSCAELEVVFGAPKNCSGSLWDSSWRRLSPAALKIKPFGAREAFQALKAVLLRPGSPEKSPAALKIKPFGARETFQTLQTVLPILKPGSPETTALSSALDQGSRPCAGQASPAKSTRS